MWTLPTARRASPWRASLLAASFVATLLVSSGFVAASGPNGILEGYITSSADASPIAGAAVQVTASNVPLVYRTRTDLNGFYAVSLPNELYDLQVSSPAFAARSDSVRVGSGQTTWMNVSLDPAVSRSVLIQGFVTDSSTDAPVTLGNVTLSNPYWYSGTQYANASALNATGYYAMRMIPGTYVLSTQRVTGYAPYTYSYFYLYAGNVRWWNFTMTAAPLVSWLNGTVTASGSSTRIVGATITAVVGGEPIGTATSNATGSYSFRVPVATVTLVGDAVGYAPTTANAYIYWAGSFTANLYLEVLSAGIRGYVRDGLTGDGLAGVLMAPTPTFTDGYYDQNTTDLAGFYAIALAPDSYSVTVSLTGYATAYDYVSMYSGGVQWLNVTLWPIVATVSGYLTDGTTGLPVSSWYVYASDARASYSAYAVSDLTGFYTLTITPSPAVTLSVTGYTPYVGTVVFLVTRPYQTVWANLTLARVDAQLQVDVSDAITGLPIASANAAAYWQTGSTWGMTNATGAMMLGVPTDVSLTVSAGAVGYYPVYGTPARVTGFGSLSIELFPEWTANVTVQGYITDGSTNTSIASAYVAASGFGSFAPYDYSSGTGFYQILTVAYPQTVRATEWDYTAGMASIDPAPGETIWLNFTLMPDTTAPLIVNFTATPSTNLAPTNPASLVGEVNESSYQSASITMYMLRSSAAGVGTFLSLGTLPASGLSAVYPSPGNVTLTQSWDTRSPVVLLSDGTTTDWWPASTSYYMYQVILSGYWSNATLAPTTASAHFDSRDGRLLYIQTMYGFFTAADQPDSTFQPYSLAVQIDLATAAIGYWSIVTGLTFTARTLHLTYSGTVPGGQYAAVLQVYDVSYNFAAAAVLLQVTVDTTAPIARAGPDQLVNQRALVTFDGSASSDNVGIVNYTWQFTDGIARVLFGSRPTYRFANAGIFAVTLIVRDAQGNAGSDSLLVTVLDTTPPSVAITSPAESANVSGSVTLLATATDNVGVVRVEFLVDGVRLGNVTSSPYQIVLDTRSLANGQHTVTAVAYDAAGNSASTVSSLTVYNAPGSGGSLLGSDLTFWIVLLVALVAVACVVVVLVMRRRRPRQPLPVPPGNPPSG